MSSIAISELNSETTNVSDNDLLLLSKYDSGNQTYTSTKLKATNLKNYMGSSGSAVGGFAPLDYANQYSSVVSSSQSFNYTVAKNGILYVALSNIQNSSQAVATIKINDVIVLHQNFTTNNAFCGVKNYFVVDNKSFCNLEYYLKEGDTASIVISTSTVTGRATFVPVY